MFILKNKANKIKETIPMKFRAVMEELENVTQDGMTEDARTLAYMAIMEKLPATERDELVKVLQRTQLMIIQAQAPKVGNRAQRRNRARMGRK